MRNTFAITAEGPSSDIMNRRENITGYTYLAPTEPAKFIPYDPEIMARVMRELAWHKTREAKLVDAANNGVKLREKLDIARKALEEIVQVGENTHIWRHVRVAREALAQISVERKAMVLDRES